VRRLSSFPLAPVVPHAARALGVPRTIDSEDAVLLTFDDGPHPLGTPAMLRILADERARATFFLVGEQVRRHPSLAAEIAAAGHAVALHGEHHRLLLRLSPQAARADLDRGAETVAEATGLPITLHRPPHGIYSPAALDHVRERGWAPLLWSRSGRDRRGNRGPGRIAAEVTRDLAAGDVLLLHDSDAYGGPGAWRHTVRALPRVLDAIAAAGLRTQPGPHAADRA
jgi:peptidoglycan/xylan/chitin deacetylase (PgdA/CDA1 family)